MLDSIGGRKFVMAVVCAVLVTVLACFDKVTGEQALYAVLGLAGTFTVGNVGEHFALSSAIKKGGGS